MTDAATAAFVRAIPKAELHVHIEGTIEPEHAFALAERNAVTLPWATAEALKDAYRFDDLQSFLDVYYQVTAVLTTVADFADIVTAYFDRAAAQGVRHVELFFDPQSHTGRGVPMSVVMDGLWSAVSRSVETHGLTSSLILCFLRDLGAEAAAETLREAEPYLDRIVGVGLDSAEAGHPPAAFHDVFAAAALFGLRRVAHAGEEGPPAYVVEALDALGAERIDHGVRALEDPALVARLAEERVPLTVCPLSNVRLRGVDSIAQHPLGRMLDAGLLVSVNSDDPAYFGGYVGDNMIALHDDPRYDLATLRVLAENSFRSAFLDDDTRTALVGEVHRHFERGVQGA
ncbi:adenosine deaminase [Herbiconiux moechotypicola]|uniref:Adenine deaminase n=1 Tax=Herbiconiux moechotypicola TaxID=637393 RepID=A0ABN3DEC8_9MICO|nr:adenosine deaminase [Herbiconiux moechotypicola]MCS5729293.1 adenosine deaminase [Herbiconiux moechotypicola]